MNPKKEDLIDHEDNISFRAKSEDELAFEPGVTWDMFLKRMEALQVLTGQNFGCNRYEPKNRIQV